ncbi:MAG: hypothetical protein U0441_29795 [Polyangiaceae bacterium]
MSTQAAFDRSQPSVDPARGGGIAGGARCPAGREAVGARARLRCALGVVVWLAAAGCDAGSGGSGATTGGATTAAATTTAAAPPPAATDPAPPPAADLDVAALQKTLACAANAKSGPCSVLAGFAGCKPWSAEVPSGDGRWLGRGYEVDGKKTTELVAVLRVRRVPSSEVGPGQLPARIALGEIAKDEGSPFTEADKAIRALERSDVPPHGNAAMEYLKKRSQWSEVFVSRTAGGQVSSDSGLYVCEGPKRELLVVRRASTRAGAADGFYATLWGATW